LALPLPRLPTNVTLAVSVDRSKYGVCTVQLPLPFCDIPYVPLPLPPSVRVAAVTVLPFPPGVKTQNR
jgi:hypothetical protein